MRITQSREPDKYIVQELYFCFELKTIAAE